MTQQVRPQQIVDRIEALVKEQKAKGYKAGWVMFKMRSLCEKKAAHVLAYTGQQQKSCNPDQVALRVAKGEISLQEALGIFEESLQWYKNAEEEFSF
jgi:hypothetical protein